MGNKLQELTDKLYNEGLSKQGRRKPSSPKLTRGEMIISNARKEAAAIIEKARKEAEDYKSNVQSDVTMAALKSVQTVKQDIENLIVEKIVDAPVSDVLSSVIS
jgi:V/A-type H+-transporting ATPase subunit E